MTVKRLWVLEPVGLAEDVGRSEGSLHFKHQFQTLPTALCLDLPAAAGSERLEALPFQRRGWPDAALWSKVLSFKRRPLLPLGKVSSLEDAVIKLPAQVICVLMTSSREEGKSLSLLIAVIRLAIGNL